MVFDSLTLLRLLSPLQLACPPIISPFPSTRAPPTHLPLPPCPRLPSTTHKTTNCCPSLPPTHRSQRRPLQGAPLRQLGIIGDDRRSAGNQQGSAGFSRVRRATGAGGAPPGPEPLRARFGPKPALHRQFPKSGVRRAECAQKARRTPLLGNDGLQSFLGPGARLVVFG